MSVSIALPLGWICHQYESVTSTMDAARHHLRDRSVIFANCQKQGRGRHQRTWISESGNFFCSLVICPQMPVKNWSELSFVTALAVGGTLDLFLPDLDQLTYKWPNDLLLQGNKISGILLEVDQGYMIIGVGINLISSPKDRNYLSACLADVNQHIPSALNIASIFVSKFQNLWYLWQHQGFADIRQQWLKRAAFKNQIVQVIVSSSNPNLTTQGQYQGIDDQGNLILKLSDGRLKYYSAGEVSLVLKDS